MRAVYLREVSISGSLTVMLNIESGFSLRIGVAGEYCKVTGELL